MPLCEYVIPSSKQQCKKNAKEGCAYCGIHKSKMENEEDEDDCIMLPVQPDINVSVKQEKTQVDDNRFKKLEEENHALQQMIVELSSRVNEISLNKSKQKKKRQPKVTDEACLRVAKNIYYRQMKKHPSVYETIKSRLQSVQIFLEPPWQMVKAYTDTLYDKLTDDEKKKLVEVARSSLIDNNNSKYQ